MENTTVSVWPTIDDSRRLLGSHKYTTIGGGQFLKMTLMQNPFAEEGKCDTHPISTFNLSSSSPPKLSPLTQHPHYPIPCSSPFLLRTFLPRNIIPRPLISNPRIPIIVILGSLIPNALLSRF